MTSLADQYLDDTADPEDQRLWAERVSIGGTLVYARWEGHRSRDLETGILRSSITERMWFVNRTALPTQPKNGTRIVALDNSVWEVLDEEDAPAVSTESNDWRIHAVRVRA